MAQRVAHLNHCLVAALLFLVQPPAATASDRDDVTGFVQMNAEVLAAKLKPQDASGKLLSDAVALAQQNNVPLKDLAKALKDMVDVNLQGKGPEICGYVKQIATPMNKMLEARLDRASVVMSKVMQKTMEAEKPLLAKVGGTSANSTSSPIAKFRILVNTTVASALAAMKSVGGPQMQTLLGSIVPMMNASTYALNRMGLAKAAQNMNKTMWITKEKGELISAVIKEAPKAIANYTDHKAKEYTYRLNKIDANLSIAMDAQIAAFDTYVKSWKDLILNMTADARKDMNKQVAKECIDAVTAPLDDIERAAKNVSARVVDVVHKLGNMVLEAETQAVAKIGLVEAESAAHTTVGLEDEVLDMAEMYSSAIGHLVTSHHDEIGEIRVMETKKEVANGPFAVEIEKKETLVVDIKKEKLAQVSKAKKQDKAWEAKKIDEKKEAGNSQAAKSEEKKEASKGEKGKEKKEPVAAADKSEDTQEASKAVAAAEKSEKEKEATKAEKSGEKKRGKRDEKKEASKAETKEAKKSDEKKEASKAEKKEAKTNAKTIEEEEEAKKSDEEVKVTANVDVEKMAANMAEEDSGKSEEDKAVQEADLGDIEEDLGSAISAEASKAKKSHKVKAKKHHKTQKDKVYRKMDKVTREMDEIQRFAEDLEGQAKNHHKSQTAKNNHKSQTAKNHHKGQTAKKHHKSQKADKSTHDSVKGKKAAH